MGLGAEIAKQHMEQGQDRSTYDETALIRSVDDTQDRVVYNTGFSGASVPITHPYLGQASWIRIMPDQGTKCYIGRRSPDGDPFITAYLSEGSSERYVKSTREERFHCRSLREGEIDISSPGAASVFTSRKGTLELKGGIVSVTLSPADLEISARSPTHTRAILGNKRQAVTDEERFGVVVRPGSLNSDIPSPFRDATIRNVVQKLPTIYAKEYLRVISSDGPIPGVFLVDHREGDVYDDDGTSIDSKTTKRALRSRTRYGTEIPGLSTDVEIDVDGNVALSLPETAITGLDVDVALGDINLDAGKDFIATASLNASISAQLGVRLESKAATIVMKAKTSATLDAGLNLDMLASIKMVLDSPLISLATGADTPAVRGADLVQYLLTHTHSSPFGPTSPPIVPPPPGILSASVTLK